jgi:hypothetical protein
VVGVGAAKGVPAAEVRALIEGALGEAGLRTGDVAELATVDSKAGETGITVVAGSLGVPLRTYPAALLAGVTVPNPSGAPLGAVGTPSVAEAAALAGGGELLVPKRKSRPADGGPARATCAVVRRWPAPAGARNGRTGQESAGREMDMISAGTVDIRIPTGNSGPHGDAPGPPVAFGGSPVSRVVRPVEGVEHEPDPTHRTTAPAAPAAATTAATAARDDHHGSHVRGR